MTPVNGEELEVIWFHTGI